MRKKYNKNHAIGTELYEIMLGQAVAAIDENNLEFAAEILFKLKDFHKAWFWLARIAQKKQELHTAIICLNKAVSLEPDTALYHFEMGNVLWQLNENKAAEVCYLKTITIDPNHSAAHVNLALAHSDISSADQQSLVLLQIANELDPDNIDTLSKLGMICQDLDQYGQALKYHKRIIELEGETHDNLVAIGDTYLCLDDINSAEEVYKKALFMEPESTVALGGLCVALNKKGKRQEAKRLLNYAVSAGVLEDSILLIAAKLCDTDDERRFIADTIFAKLPTVKTKDNRRKLLFVAGNLYDKLKQYKIAFDCYKEANDLKNAKFDREKFVEVFEEIKKIKINESNNSHRPVFIVGMPRSGTTLLEQSLAMHPDICGAGEQQAIASMIKKNETDIAKKYLLKLDEWSSGEKYVINKLPYNFLFIGIIKKIFPNATIIHCRRNRKDTCLSIYFQDFLNAHEFTYNMKDIDWYYDRYLMTMKYWNIETIDVDYEDMVFDQKNTIMKVLDKLNLDFDAQCLDFHKSDRIVNTASFQQIRKPLYTSSVDRWKNYEHIY